MSVDVSIIVVHYNTPVLTEACVRSVLRFTKGCTYELLVVDNASTVGDIRPLADLDERVRLLRQEENLGFAGGNNAGWAVARGQYILLLNSDTELISDAVTASLQALKAEPQVGLLTVKLIYADGRPQYPTGAFPTLTAELLALTRLEKFLSREARIRRYYGDLADPDKVWKPDWVWGAYWLAPRQVLEQMPGGKLAEDFFLYYEDVLWGWVVRKQLGWEVLYTPVASVVHHLSGSEAQQAGEEAKYRRRIFPNERKFLEKCYGKLYARAFYLVRILHLLSLRTPADREKAGWYWSQIFR